MKTLPITFTHNGKAYTGELRMVMGAGISQVWYLYINKNYKGTLHYANKWVFDGEFGELADFYGI